MELMYASVGGIPEPIMGRFTSLGEDTKKSVYIVQKEFADLS